MIAVDYKLPFFDSPAVMRRVEAGERRMLSRAGAFIRKVARNSLRRRKRASQPGETPSIHAASGDFASLKSIFFAYDFGSQSMVCGPVGLNVHNYLGGSLSKGAVPQILEFGGVLGIREKRAKASVGRPAGEWRSIGRRKPRPWEEVRVRRATYAPRPFMGPALRIAIEQGVIPKSARGLLAAA